MKAHSRGRASGRFTLAWLTGVFALAGVALSSRTDPETVAVIPSGPEESVSFGRDIRPILSDRCFKCHGPDAGTREADLRLDERDQALADRDGSRAIVAGDRLASELWRRINATDPKVVMPPPESGKRPLSAAERDALGRWIDEGAVYEAHWAFVAPVRPEPPPVRGGGWVRTPVDAFVLAALEARNIDPSPEADRATLARRVFLDITGLPPTPEELEAFERDEAPDAYERLVDRLLSQEPYATRRAERMATPWLDAARYADTIGIHTDAGRQMWAWRDWVINAYRENMPFDRFLTEQIAGDLLPDATRDQVVASGFNRNHVMTDEGGAISEEYLVEYAVDRVNTTGSVFLGLTLGCARCHDHKFDPVTMTDYYSLLSFFNSVEEPGLYSQLPDPNRAFEPFIEVPTPEQAASIAELEREVEERKSALGRLTDEDRRARDSFFQAARSSVRWEVARPTVATSAGGADLTIQGDGSVLASGANPDQDTFDLTLAPGPRSNLVMIEAMADPSLPSGRVGRSPNGNAVVSAIEILAGPPDQARVIPMTWAWADVSQDNGDFHVTNVLQSAEGDKGWAVDAHRQQGNRRLLVMLGEDLGENEQVRVRVIHRSIYAKHTLGRVRIWRGTQVKDGMAVSPAMSRWYIAGPFTGEARDKVFDRAFGPELEDRIDLAKDFGGVKWRYDGSVMDGAVARTPDGVNATYVARHIYAPAPMPLEVSIGSDDGFRLFVNGVEAASNRVDRGAAPDQDKATIQLRTGRNLVMLKIVNTGGIGGVYFAPAPTVGRITEGLVPALLPQETVSEPLMSLAHEEWMRAFLPSYARGLAELRGVEAKLTAARAGVAKTMVMKDLAMPRPTYILKRGQYDSPDLNQPVSRAVPTALGTLREDAPPNRLGLANWLTSPENPLVARVAANRVWEMVFGWGLVRTSEDFGLQGEWPTHPELLDYLAVELRESGWDLNGLIRVIVTSSTYRQSSRVRPDLAEVDPENRLLAYYPRRRLGAEQIRDSALYVAGLLRERVGGPSVKPYQPDGLWPEVAMVQSNTRNYERGTGDDLWRRSLYTYWKRACPPPSLQTFDAPPREFCTIRRATTNTPLQALVTWNDEQFVEAARVLAEQGLKGRQGDEAVLNDLMVRCVGREPEPAEREALMGALEDFRQRFTGAPADAAKLVEVGESMPDASMDPQELAAWTMIASCILNLHEFITQR